MGATLRPHQQMALDQVRYEIRDGQRRIMLAAPTGTGKTLMAADLVDEARSRGWRIIFVVPALSQNGLRFA